MENALNKNTINVYIKTQGNGRIPEYASIHAAGCDLYATEDMALRPGETKVMPLNFIIATEPDIEAQIRPRSGLSLKTQLRIPNGPGTIDSDYRDIVGVILENTYNIANLPYQIAQNPNLINILKNEYKEMELMKYLAEFSGPKAAEPKSESEAYADFADMDYAGLSILQEKIYIDKHGNPFGTIYIKKGERIAQMIFSEYKRANFIYHPNAESIGEDRGGGFGHSG